MGLRRGSRAGRGWGRCARRSGGAAGPAGRCRCRRRPGSRRRRRAPARAASEKALPSGPLTQTPSPASSSQSRSVPGRSPSIRKSSRTPSAAGLGVGDRERPRQERPLRPLRPSAARRRACRTGPAAGSGPSPVEQREDPVAARGTVLGDLAEPPPEAARSSRLLRPSVGARGSPGGSGPRRPSLLGGDRPGGRRGAGHRRHAGDAVADRGGADLVAVGAGAGAGRGVDHQVAAALADQVDDVRASPRRAC